MPLLAEILPPGQHGAKRTRRNYIHPEDPFLQMIGADRADLEPPFDCIAESEFETREDAAAAMQAFFNPGVWERIAEDEAKFIETDSTRFYVVEVHETVLA